MTGGDDMEQGLVQVYTGDGKGKTTAALGLAMRAVGKGMKVLMVQFLKGRKYGELETCRRLGDDFRIIQSGLDSFVKKGEPSAEDLRLAREGLEAARAAIMSGDYDIVILDEANVAVELGVLEVEDVLPLIDERPSGVEVVLTGRYAPEEFCERADVLTEMRCVKHCFDKGVPMREGIEF
jgi:cob(I)alamin adenosyltransferase